MLRGLQKKMIVIRTQDSRMFEEAYFVMRGDGVSPADRQGDMLAEAYRIINGSLPSPEEKAPPTSRLRPLRQWLWFLLGAAVGAGSMGALWWWL